MRDEEENVLFLEDFILKRKVFRTNTIKCFGCCHGDRQWATKGKEENRFDLGVGKSFLQRGT